MTSYINQRFPYLAIILVCFFLHIRQTKVNANVSFSDPYHGLSNEEIYISKIFGEDKIYTIDGIQDLNLNLNGSENKNRDYIPRISLKNNISLLQEKILMSKEKLQSSIPRFALNGTLRNSSENSFILNNTNLVYPKSTRKLLALNPVNPNFSMKFYVPKTHENEEKSVNDTNNYVINTKNLLMLSSEDETIRLINCSLLYPYYDELNRRASLEHNGNSDKNNTKLDYLNSTFLRLRNYGSKFRALRQQINETTNSTNFLTLDTNRQNSILNMFPKHVRHQQFNSTPRFHKLFLLDNITKPNLFNSTGIRLLPSYSANITVIERKIDLPHPNISKHLSKLNEFGDERLENRKKIMSKYIQKLNTTKQALKEKMSLIKEKERQITAVKRTPFRNLNRPPFLDTTIYPKVENAVLPPLSAYFDMYNSTMEGRSEDDSDVFVGISKMDEFPESSLNPKIYFYGMEVQNAIKLIQKTSELATQCRFMGLLHYLMLTGKIYQPDENLKGEDPINCFNFCSLNHLSDVLDSSVTLSKSAEILQKKIHTLNETSIELTGESLENEKKLAALSIKEAEHSRVSLNQVLAELEAFQIILTKGKSTTYFNLVNNLKSLYFNQPLKNKEEEFTTSIEGIQKFIERLSLYWSFSDETLEKVKNIRMRCNEIINMMGLNSLEKNDKEFDTKIFDLINILENIRLKLSPLLNYASTLNSEKKDTDKVYILTFAPNDVFESLAEVSTTNPLKNTKESQDKKVEQLISKFQMESTNNINEIGFNLLKRLRQNSLISFEQLSSLKAKFAKIKDSVPDDMHQKKSLVLLPAILHHALRMQGYEAERIHSLLNKFKMSRVRSTENEPNSDGNALTVRDVLANLKSAIFQTPRKFYTTERKERYLKSLLDNKISNVKSWVMKIRQNEFKSSTGLQASETIDEKSYENNDTDNSKKETRSLQKLIPSTSKLPSKIHVLHVKKSNADDLLEKLKENTKTLSLPALQKVNTNCSRPLNQSNGFS
ncbi:uncharacterized protein LOC128883155 [Hylaeus volcanicus]|uniref:uncharacterized protein LOC128883155 n=1 Tax=Hylaeus volcanicus TaxID=313075 RepID=UPI0023B7EEFD|nr:uncharacterized protein LOC128883155 [Hylaeus volcanicus]